MPKNPSSQEKEHTKTPEEAFLDAFDTYANPLYRHAFFRVSDEELAQDLVSDTFTKTWDFVASGGVVREFRPFLYQTLNRRIIDEYRKKKATSLDALLEKEEGGTMFEARFDELIEGSREEVEFHIDARQAATLIAHLPEQHQTIITLRYINGMQPKEIAEILELPTNTISVRIHRALQELTRIYNKKVAGNNGKSVKK